MLTGPDGLPMRQDELPSDYPLPVAWDGFLVDDPDHPRDIVAAVERTLALVWPGRLDEFERDACEILGIPDLRAWFRDPKGFFNFHTKRYSKSRRKAPIYWLLQSAKRNYAIWLYYPRLNPSSLYQAGREYADAKLNLEMGRLADWQSSLGTTSGSARKIQERKIAGQEALVDELKDFLKTLDAAALLELKPDLNDGVLLNIAPLHELVPWKEAGRAWNELLQGKYEWSSIGVQLRQKGLIKKRRNKLMGIVANTLIATLQEQLDLHKVVVWFDPEKAYTSVVEALETKPLIPDVKLAVYEPEKGFLWLRRELEPVWGGEEPPRLLIYVPHGLARQPECPGGVHHCRGAARARSAPTRAQHPSGGDRPPRPGETAARRDGGEDRGRNRKRQAFFGRDREFWPKKAAGRS